MKTRAIKPRRTARAIAFLLTLLMMMGSFGALLGVSAATEWKYDFPSGSAPVNITLDGKTVLAGEAAIINATTYVPLRRLCDLVGVDSITWNPKTNVATVKHGSTTIEVPNHGSYITANGRIFYSKEPIRNISDRLFVPIRPIAEALCLSVNWNSLTRTAELRRTGKVLISSSLYYDKDDCFWLARIIHAEAQGESLEGKIAVGNVVLNRVRHPAYPSTIYGVIFDRKHGTQFSPVSFGTIYNTPGAESVIAAKICLEGYSVDENILFFMNPRIATNNWISKNRPYAFTIGRHDFYY